MIEIQTCPDGRVICRLLADLDWHEATCLRDVVHDLLGPELDMVLDLHEVGFIDGVGIERAGRMPASGASRWRNRPH